MVDIGRLRAVLDRLGAELVHQYVDVDDRRVIEIVRHRLPDLDRFRVAVAALV